MDRIVTIALKIAIVKGLLVVVGLAFRPAAQT
jgi:hypothetical protein